MGNCLEGRLHEFFNVITSTGEPKYATIKKRVIEEVSRIKASVHYKRKDDFSKAKMLKNEGLLTYAHRLETLARIKFGDHGINDNKPLMRKFVETIPSNVAHILNRKRKDKKRWKGERLKWHEVLELLEDREIEEEDSPDLGDKTLKSSVFFNTQKSKPAPQTTVYSSYRDALAANPIEVMAKYMESMDTKIASSFHCKGCICFGTPKKGQQSGPSHQIGASAPAGNQGSAPKKCFRCQKLGHISKDCRWTTGSCFRCGSKEHRIAGCRVPGAECPHCKQFGHPARSCPQATRGPQTTAQSAQTGNQGNA